MCVSVGVCVCVGGGVYVRMCVCVGSDEDVWDFAMEMHPLYDTATLSTLLGIIAKI